MPFTRGGPSCTQAPQRHTTMRCLPAIALCCLALLPVFIAGQPPAGAPVFPEVSSYALDKSRFNVPGDFAGQLNVLILLFERDQEGTARGWQDALLPVLGAHPEVKAYTLPVFSRVNLLARWYINGSMRSSSPDASHWHETIPLYVDKAGLLESLHVVSEKQLVLMIADKAGHVYWQASGAPTPENQAALTGALSAVLARH